MSLEQTWDRLILARNALINTIESIEDADISTSSELLEETNQQNNTLMLNVLQRQWKICDDAFEAWEYLIPTSDVNDREYWARSDEHGALGIRYNDARLSRVFFPRHRAPLRATGIHAAAHILAHSLHAAVSPTASFHDPLHTASSVSYTHLTLPTKRIV